MVSAIEVLVVYYYYYYYPGCIGEHRARATADTMGLEADADITTSTLLPCPQVPP